MKSAIYLLAAFFSCAHAGNVCFAGTYKASRIDISKLYAFAAGSPCVDGRSIEYPVEVRKLCDNLPWGVNVCGQNGNLVKLDPGKDWDGDANAFPGCQIGLEIDGVVYPGETYGFNPDNANDHRGPCDADCGLMGLDGFLQFVGVPMC